MKILAAAFLFLIACSFKINAHQLSTAYLNLTKTENEQLVLKGQWQVAVIDLEHVIPFDINTNDVITWQEIKTQEESILKYLAKHLVVNQNDIGCKLHKEGDLKIDSHFNESYIVVPVQITCPTTQAFTINYSALFEVDANHKAIADIANFSRVFTLSENNQSFDTNLPN
ncbi:hypothetical protein NH514_14125 [Pseudoalteromonas sp. ACER1]|uniref:hypothetical protein n=1 Tax=unclassified Pseudoalteromonas TaxID=194690 RepID=UPI001F3FDBD7|nr:MULTISPECIES: hypothetical protein [unclassified Pseudoalteromonas]MCF2848381.1 hypothetical protein [Pseudoalteromonas sp. PAST1]MCO7211867.1 hypothetical protein [Pseudoalteromonas sp. ACER1]|tara:strand:+ start:152 stop:661 length:510 start_codon:yes stop_codon:yes gene_type:complete